MRKLNMFLMCMLVVSAMAQPTARQWNDEVTAGWNLGNLKYSKIQRHQQYACRQSGDDQSHEAELISKCSCYVSCQYDNGTQGKIDETAGKDEHKCPRRKGRNGCVHSDCLKIGRFQKFSVRCHIHHDQQ